MRVEALATGRVAQRADELAGLGPGGGIDHGSVSGIGTAIENVVAHRAVQQRGVLRDHADVLAQAVLRDAGDVLAVDHDAPRLHVVEAQQQVDEGRLAGAGAADHADLLARADAQLQPLDHRAVRAGGVVGEGDVIEHDLAMRHRQRRRIRPVDHGARTRERADAVLHGADVLEQRGHLPHHPVRHAVQAQRHRSGRRECPHADLAAHPQPQRHTRGRHDQAHAQQVVDHLEAADQAHLPVHRAQEFAHRAAGKAGFAPPMREQLDGGDVGVGVRDAPGHQRTRVRLLLPDAGQARNEVAHRQRIQQQPDRERPQQPEVEPPGQRGHGDEVDDHEDQDVAGDHGGVAHRQRRLHHLRRHPAGELVLVEGHALAEHQPVEVPAQAHREVARQRLVLEHGLQQHQHGAAHHQGGQPEQAAPLFGPELLRRRAAQPVDQIAEHPEQVGLEGTRARGQQRHGQDVGAHAGGAAPHEAQESAGWRGHLGRRKRIDQALEFL